MNEPLESDTAVRDDVVVDVDDDTGLLDVFNERIVKDDT